jgi:hypothetical protein
MDEQASFETIAKLSRKPPCSQAICRGVPT